MSSISGNSGADPLSRGLTRERLRYYQQVVDNAEIDIAAASRGRRILRSVLFTASLILLPVPLLVMLYVMAADLDPTPFGPSPMGEIAVGALVLGGLIRLAYGAATDSYIRWVRRPGDSWLIPGSPG
ncbi:hypothetical protein HGQ17_14185 [Nesterenkonia sp. MY13]|uniref:Uncharacterized protein n=1 Tax=Nesterenkonia sedimenti TaxID=1463632 RepID=A0A7X8YF37_9MICC|nr:hypothetical protein [Nesterenkonia sedimenti]NLS11125.1 hypothetical protein [Nesterenkonia sedimenti]